MITGGGTGGHIFPALAIAESLKERGFEVLFVGGRKGLETKLVPKSGLPFIAIRSGAVKNQGVLTLFTTGISVVLGFLSALVILLKHRPKAVIGVGGYVSVPVVLAAFILRRKIFLQEQNASVGIANRFLGKMANTVFLGFEEARSAFPKGTTCIVSGNPIRKAFNDPGLPFYRPNGNSLLVVGGSQGARAINDAVLAALPEIQKTFPGIKITHQTGPQDHGRILEGYKKSFKGECSVLPFIDDMPTAYAKASLVIGRAGALTVSELLAVKRPCLFVPYPRKGQNDQTANAYYMEKQGVSRVVEQGEKFHERFWDSLEKTFQVENLTKMYQAFSGLKKNDALKVIGDQVCAKVRPTFA